MTIATMIRVHNDPTFPYLSPGRLCVYAFFLIALAVATAGNAFAGGAKHRGLGDHRVTESSLSERNSIKDRIAERKAETKARVAGIKE
ncbi:MAG: hypothetical protein WBN68_13670, partial [Sedimenticolaceae bacterium]